MHENYLCLSFLRKMLYKGYKILFPLKFYLELQPLTIITKSSILDFAVVLDPPLIYLIYF